MSERMFTVASESVSEGHPDKFCDQLSDAIVDACLAQDPTSRVAVESLVKNDKVVVAGEVTTAGELDVKSILDATVDEIDYTEAGFDDGNQAFRDSWDCEPGNLDLMVELVEQSNDIKVGVDGQNDDEVGAGDQGMMFGYASNETEALMPRPILLAHQLIMTYSEQRKAGNLPGCRPDAKSMVSVNYHNGKPVDIGTVLMSAQVHTDVGLDELREMLLELVVTPSLGDGTDLSGMEFLVNPTGTFVLGGAKADAGLTGRKIIVDTYGGVGRHGGGAFSGKDSTKVDRSAAYAMRWVAKHVVAAGAADRCELQVSYAIGRAAPVSLHVETFGTEKVDPAKIEKVIADVFDLRPAAIQRNLDLRRPIFKKTAVGGHFGRSDPEFTWEATPHAAAMAQALGL